MTWGPESGDAWAPAPPPGTPPTAPPYGATAWHPDGAPDTVRRPVVVPPGPPPPAGPPTGKRPSRAAVVVVAVTLVVAVAVAIGLVVGSAGDDAPTPQAGATGATTATSSRGSTSAPAPAPAPVTTTVTESTSPTPTPTSTPGQTYTGPGGLTVQGPAGWVPDRVPESANVADFLAPSSGARLAGATFRIGIGNTDHSMSWADEVDQAVQVQLDGKVAASILAGPTSTSYQGTTAADIVYTYFNTDYQIQRVGYERIWRRGAVTLLIQTSDVDRRSAATSAIFQQLVTSATVT